MILFQNNFLCPSIIAVVCISNTLNSNIDSTLDVSNERVRKGLHWQYGKSSNSTSLSKKLADFGTECETNAVSYWFVT